MADEIKPRNISPERIWAQMGKLHMNLMAAEEENQQLVMRITAQSKAIEQLQKTITELKAKYERPGDPAPAGSEAQESKAAEAN